MDTKASNSDAQTKPLPGVATGLHERISVLEKEVDDIWKAGEILSDGKWDEKDGPALIEIAQSVGKIVMELGLAAASAVYIATEMGWL